MKQATLSLICILYAFFLNAQESSWTYKDRDDFISNCVTAASGGMSIDSAKHYCYCMMSILEKSYPDPKQVVELSDNDLSSPEWKAKIRACLGLPWPASFRANFMENCVGAAKAHLGEADARSYCDCMMYKVQLIYPNYVEADQISQETLASPAFQKLIRSCLPPKSD